MKQKRMIVVLKYKKIFLFEEIDKNIQFNTLFLGIHETFISVRVRKREVYRKQTISHLSVILSKVSALEHEQFMQASLCIISLLFVNTLT